MMEMFLKRKEPISRVAVFFLVFYSYNITFQSYFFGSRMGAVLIFLSLSALCALDTRGRSLRGKLKTVTRCWILLSVLSLYNNQDLINDSQSRWLVPMAAIYLMCALTKRASWIDVFIGMSRFFTLFHAFFTIFFYVFKGLYVNYFIRLVPGDHTFLLDTFYQGGMPGLTSHYSTNGIYLGFGLLFFASELISNRNANGHNLTFHFMETLFVAAALILTSKRAHILFAGLSIVIMFFVYYSNAKTARWFYLLLFTALTGTLFFASAPFVPAVSHLLDRFIHPELGDITHGRLDLWDFAFRQFLKSPLIGIGWGGFKHRLFQAIGSYGTTSDWADAHNVFVQLLCEQGIVGVTLFSAALFGGISLNWNALKQARLHPGVLGRREIKRLTLALGLQVFFALYCVTGNCLYDVECLCPYMLGCAMAYSVMREADDSLIVQLQTNSFSLASGRITVSI